jgi:hypothetical protein
VKFDEAKVQQAFLRIIENAWNPWQQGCIG